VNPAPVLYVLKRFPRLSETFVLREILELESCGERILVDALMRPEDGPRHGQLADLRAPIRYLRRHPRLREAPIARAHARVAVRAPLKWLLLAMRAHRRGEWRRFVQAGLVADRARREHVRHIHAHFATAAAEVARDAAALVQVPVSVTCHAKDIWQRENASQLARRLSGMSAVVTVSEFNARHLRAVAPSVPVYHIPNGVALGRAVTPDPKGPVLFVARLVTKKGIDVLVEAIALLARENSRLHLDVIGGPLTNELVRLARQRGVEGRVRWFGPRPWEDVEVALERCSMFVLPCRVASDGDRDGMPTALIEAMARGVPVISTEVAGIPEVVRHGDTGFLVPPDDPMALAVAVRKLHDDPSLAAELGRRGRALVGDHFDPRSSAERLRGLFSSGAL
jgi:colanic acid/amylovoran biosynthesis glycosyltransferase